MKRILGVLLAGVLLLSGCGQWQKSQKESAYHLYCLDKTGTTLVQEPYEPKEGTDQKLIKELVDALQEKPAKDGNQALLSNGTSIKSLRGRRRFWCVQDWCVPLCRFRRWSA